MTKLVVNRLTPDVSSQEYAPIAEDRVVDGAPTGRALNQYTNTKENFFAGVWESTEGCWNLNYTEDEMCVIIEGEAIITDAEGVETRVVQGDSFTVPAGFKGTWRTIGHVKKWYAIYEE